LADGDGLVARNLQEDRLLVQDVQINNLKKETGSWSRLMTKKLWILPTGL
jgi:hypothetical protein